MRSFVVGRYHYIVNGDGGEELYDFIADPSERNNLAIAGDIDHILATTRSSLRRVFEHPASDRDVARFTEILLLPKSQER